MLNRVLSPAGVAALLFAACSIAFAQSPRPPSQDVLARVPDGCVLFAVVTGAGEVAAKVDAFAELVSPPDEPLLPASLLELIKSQAGIGQGFRPAGGFAAVLLDPKAYGLAPAELIQAIREGKKLSSDRVPLVMLIPGSDAKQMFALRKPTSEGDVVRFTGKDKKPRYCLQAGSYVALGANLKAVRAVAAGGKSVLKRLSAADKAFIVASDMTVWFEPTKGGPILSAGMARLGKRFAPAAGGEMPARTRLMRLFGAVGGRGAGGQTETFEQMDSAMIGLRFGKEGLLADLRYSFRPDSPLGKTFAAYKPVEVDPFDRLPNGPYALAVSFLNEPKAPKELASARLEKALAAEPLKSLPEKSGAEYRRVSWALREQIRSVQLYLGTASGAGGAGRMACVLECVSAGEARKLLAALANVAGEALRATKDEQLKTVSVKHTRNALKLNGGWVDAIDVKVAGATPNDLKRMKALWGGESLRFLLAEADAKTVVITLGGGKDFLAQAMRSAAGRSGKLARDKNAAKALAMLPKKRVAVGLVNARNVQVLLKAAKAATGGEIVPVDLVCEVPLAGGAWVEGAELRAAFRFPTEPVRDLVKLLSAVLAEEEQQE